MNYFCHQNLNQYHLVGVLVGLFEFVAFMCVGSRHLENWMHCFGKEGLRYFHSNVTFGHEG